MALHEVQLKGYSVRPGNLSLGTFDSYGIEQLHVTADDSWDGLDILAVFHAPDGTATKVVVGADGMLAVPPEATAKQAGVGRIVFVGLAENVQRITVDIGYNIKPHSDIEGDNPGTPTPDVVQQILANSNNAVSIATAAQDAAENARQAAEDAAKKAGEGAGGAAASAAAAKKSAADADNTVNSIKDSMAQISENKEAVSKLKEDTAALKKRQNVLVGSETGNPISCNDAYSAPLCGLTVYGKSTQDGTPTPDAPVPIVSAGDGGSVVVKVSDGNGKEQTLTLPTPNGLPGIPVTSGGNYTDQNGQQWVCDEVDLERGVRVQMVTTMVFSDSSGFAASSTTNGIRFLRAVKNLKITDTATADANAFCSALALGANGGTWLTPDVFTITKTALYVRFKNITSLGELQQYLQQTPMSLTAILATPIETPLFPAEIAAYKALTAYAPDTVVQASDGAGIKLDYQRDVNLVVKNLEDAIASMTTT